MPGGTSKLVFLSLLCFSFSPLHYQDLEDMTWIWLPSLSLGGALLWGYSLLTPEFPFGPDSEPGLQGTASFPVRSLGPPTPRPVWDGAWGGQ